MVAKFVIILSMAAAAYAGLLPASKVVYAEPEAPAHYEFSYSVQDGHSGDVKQQQESRAGDAVSGSYSLVQPDGVRRVVHYTADDHQGFNAVVSYEGTPVHPAPAKVLAAAPVTKIAYGAPVAKVAYAAPVAKFAYSAPIANVAYSAPITKVAYAAPVAKVAYAAPVAKVTYAAAPSVAQVSYSSPIISYQH